MKKYREYPLTNQKRPFIKNSSQREQAYGVIKERQRKSGKLRIINMSTLWILWCSNNNEET